MKTDNEVLNNLMKNGVTKESLVGILSESILRIIPNIILNKREESIPILISAVNLNTDPTVRDKLLQQLFNLKKRPVEQERAMILTGDTIEHVRTSYTFVYFRYNRDCEVLQGELGGERSAATVLGTVGSQVPRKTFACGRIVFGSTAVCFGEILLVVLVLYPLTSAT